jgi:hypothetical protein
MQGKFYIAGVEVQPGDIVRDFRGEEMKLEGWHLPGKVANGARVEVSDPNAEGPAGGVTFLYYTGVVKGEIHYEGEVFRS